MNLPTFVHRTLEQYRAKRDGMDLAVRYKSLEAAWSATIKYVGVVAAATASVYAPRRAGAVRDAILNTSSLGGWLSAMELLCAVSKPLPEHVREYLGHFNDYKKHPDKSALDRLGDTFNGALEALQRVGYRVERVQSPSLIRLLDQFVVIRNKHAHGHLSPVVLQRLEKPLFEALKGSLRLFPFGQAKFAAPYGVAACEFVGLAPKMTSRPAKLEELWLEGSLFERHAVPAAPFAVFHGDSERVFLLNTSVERSGSPVEYIDHATGSIMYWEVPERFVNGEPHRRLRRPSPKEVAKARRLIENLVPSWEELDICKDSLARVKGRSGVYCFLSDARLGSIGSDAAILYVGSSRVDMSSRLREYLRHREGYDSTRREVAQMFKAYEDIRLHFASTDPEDAIKLEQAIYTLTQPAYNLVAPGARAFLEN